MSSELQLDCLLPQLLWWWHLVNATKERQAWCCLQVKLCGPCLSALCVPWCKKALYKYSSFPFLSFPFFSFPRYLILEGAKSVCSVCLLAAYYHPGYRSTGPCRVGADTAVGRSPWAVNPRPILARSFDTYSGSSHRRACFAEYCRYF